VNDAGVIFGSYADGSNHVHGFIDNQGSFSQIDIPGATSTSVFAVDTAGTYTGTFTDSRSNVHGFVASGASWTAFDAAGANFTSPVAINASGEIVGDYYDQTGNEHGFTYTNGVLTPLDVPGAIETVISGINDSGEIVGYYYNGAVHGFADNDGTVVTEDVPGASQTEILGVTETGVVYGDYNDSQGIQHGFFGTVSPIAATLSLTGAEYLVDLESVNTTTSALDVQVTLGVGAELISAPTNRPVNRIGGQDTIIGDGQHDQVTFATASAGYVIAPDGLNGINLTAPANTTSYQLDNVEYLSFSDQTIFVESADNASIARLYFAALNRAPDIGGLSGWENAYANDISAATKAQGVYASLALSSDGHGTSIAGGFTQSAEFQHLYGALTDAQYVAQLYQNVLGRAPDQAGLDGWLNALHDGGYTRDMVLVGFAESSEAIAKTANWLITV